MGRAVKLLFLGDINGAPGKTALERHLPALRERWAPDVIVANAENARNGSGLTPELYRTFRGWGIDAITLGDHVFRDPKVVPLLEQPEDMARALGEVMTEPKPKVWFEEPDAEWEAGAIRLDRRSRMMYDDYHIFINGEAYRAGGEDAELMRRLADERRLDAASVEAASEDAQALLSEWFVAGWLHPDAG